MSDKKYGVTQLQGGFYAFLTLDECNEYTAFIKDNEVFQRFQVVTARLLWERDRAATITDMLGLSFPKDTCKLRDELHSKLFDISCEWYENLKNNRKD